MGRNAASHAAQARVRWSEEIKRWRDSGLTMLAWCREHRVSYTQMTRWRRRIESTRDTASLTLISVATTSAKQGSVTVRLANGVSIEVERGFDAVLLSAVVRTLTEPAAC